ncbi:DMT family transporter [Oceanibaculum pacificum]|uniref:EamA domain-containing protein n=1 Tax=Oceanibaculum pacificum TaxID=580166 RepID=A0A154W8B4_9PROT|nr:DMT family transporter [Oceanibaculum pacificum]KZD09751.1 hypothetical protein AUP43_06790 [Oceanibaculum pacificum]
MTFLEPWIAVTVVAAALQCVRTALQRSLSGTMSAIGATYVRYLFGAPWAGVLLAILLLGPERDMPSLPGSFFLWCLLGGTCQIIGTWLLLIAFRLRNFAVGTVFAKTETVQVALLSSMILGEALGLMSWLGVLVSLAGVFLLSLMPQASGAGWRGRLRDLSAPATRIGLAAGFLFAVCAVTIRAGAQSLGDQDPLLRALTVLTVMSAIQTVLMTVYVVARERRQFALMLANAPKALLIGLTSIAGSMGWYLAMTLETPAKVQAVGQIELVFTVLVSRLAFGERPRLSELAGIALIVLGILALLASR